MAPAPSPDGDVRAGVGRRPAPAELAASLVSLRERAGLGVDEVAERTRIRPALIRGMEAGNFAPCGGAVYARGHLRTIAAVVGADAGPLLDAYDRMAGEPSPSATRIADEHYDEQPARVPFARVAAAAPPIRVTGTLEPDDEQHRTGPASSIVLPGAATPPRRTSRWVVGAVVVAGLVVLALAVQLVLPLIDADRSTTAVRGPTAIRSPASPQLTTAAPARTRPAAVLPAGVTVAVRVGASPSWVHVSDAAGTVLFQGVVPAGTTRSFHSGSALSFVFGNVTAVDLLYDGRDVGAPKVTGGGVVARATFAPSRTG